MKVLWLRPILANPLRTDGLTVRVDQGTVRLRGEEPLGHQGGEQGISDAQEQRERQCDDDGGAKLAEHRACSAFWRSFGSSSRVLGECVALRAAGLTSPSV